MSTCEALLNTLIFFQPTFTDTRESELDARSIIDGISTVTKNHPGNRLKGAHGVVDFWVCVANRLGVEKYFDVCRDILDKWALPIAIRWHIRMEITIWHINFLAAHQFAACDRSEDLRVFSPLIHTLINYINIVDDAEQQTKAKGMVYELSLYLHIDSIRKEYHSTFNYGMPDMVTTALEQFISTETVTPIQWDIWCAALENAEEYCARTLCPQYIGDIGFYFHRDRHFNWLTRVGTEYEKAHDLDIRTRFKDKPNLLQVLTGNIPRLWPETIF